MLAKVIDLNTDNHSKFMSFLESSDFQRIVSTGCDYYYLADAEDSDKDFEVGEDYIMGSETGIDWLESQVQGN